MFRKFKKIPKAIERKITFDGETICALGRAFKKNPEVVRDLAGVVGEENMKIFTDILINTNEMEIKYDPSEELKTLYGQIAKRELERIEAEDEDDEDLTCGHTVDEHREALETVVEKMTPTVN